MADTEPNRLVPYSERRATMQHLMQMEVWSAANLELHFHIELDNTIIEGEPETGFVLLNATEHKIFIGEGIEHVQDFPLKQFAEQICGYLVEDILERVEALWTPAMSLEDGNSRYEEATDDLDDLWQGSADTTRALTHSTTVSSSSYHLQTPKSANTVTSVDRSQDTQFSHDPADQIFLDPAVLDSAVEIMLSHTNNSIWGVSTTAVAQAHDNEASTGVHDALTSVVRTFKDLALNSDSSSLGDLSANSRTTRRSRGLRGFASGAVEEFQQQVGFAGELVIYKLLKAKFAINDACWTSHLRSQHGLTEFLDDESLFADFTIRDIDTVAGIVEWLRQNGLDHSARTAAITAVHLEVKATVGRREEPFSLSSSQVRNAHQWHNSAADVYSILRVYDLRSERPKIQVYVDPFAAMMNGGLRFAAEVQPA